MLTEWAACRHTINLHLQACQMMLKTRGLLLVSSLEQLKSNVVSAHFEIFALMPRPPPPPVTDHSIWSLIFIQTPNVKCSWQNVQYGKHVGRRLWLLKSLTMSNYQNDEEYSNLPATHTHRCICMPRDRQQLLSGAKEDVSRVRSRAACMPKYYKS